MAVINITRRLSSEDEALQIVKLRVESFDANTRVGQFVTFVVNIG